MHSCVLAFTCLAKHLLPIIHWNIFTESGERRREGCTGSIMSNDNHYFGVEIMLQHDLETEDSKPGNKYKVKIKWRLTAANEILVV